MVVSNSHLKYVFSLTIVLSIAVAVLWYQRVYAQPLAPDSFDPSIIGGNEVTITEQERRGLVQVGGGCSGVLLSNDSVLTAGHCISNHHNPTSVVVTANWGTSANRTRAARSIYKFADFNEVRGADLALVYLESPFQVFGAISGYNVQLNLAEPNSLLNTTVAAFGLGLNQLPDVGFGTWRTANLTISGTDGRIFHYPTNSNGQMIAPGDSGGPDFIGSKLTGIHSGVYSECADNSTPAACKATITRIHGGFSVSIPAMKSAIQAVRVTNWDSNRNTYWLDVFSDEINATRYGWSNQNDVNEVEWGLAFRAANEMCFNRGFIGGHFSGHVVLEHDLHGLVCGGPGAVWYDATQAEIQATGYGFLDTNLTHWAHANRAATALCEGFERGFVGGHFNGHQFNGRYGLICYSDGAQWFDVTRSEYSDLGYDILDVNLTHWAYAMRAANDFCVSKGFVGGYMNGHQLDGRFGTVCQGNSSSSDSGLAATLAVDYTTGAPGSYFQVTGRGFTPNSQETLLANGVSLGSVQTDVDGSFTVVLSTYFADIGSYWLSTETPSAPLEIHLHMSSEVRPRSNHSQMELLLSADRAIHRLYMPVVQR
ncbi:MAG: trypsin-like serine protease [Caldilinea sp.]|jgi:hypothetical protein|nr:trypsin-like serine protease [Caldilinea sp.]